MKDTHFLYGIAILAVVGILACFIGYATNTLPMHAPRQLSTTTPAVTDTAAVKTKGCGCCAERIAKFRQRMEKLRKREKAAAQNMDSE